MALPSLGAPAPRRHVAIGGGRTLAYVEAGDGPPLILVHGALVNLDDMVLGPMDVLAETHRVIAFDRPGHGESPRRDGSDASPWRQAELIRAASRALGVEQALVLGHSFGAAVALAHALRFPDATAGVVALAPIVWPEVRLELLLFGPRAVPGPWRWLEAGPARALDGAILPVLWRGMFKPQAMPENFERCFSFASAGSMETTVSTGEDAVAVVTDLWRSAAAYRGCRPPVVALGGDADIVVDNRRHGASLPRLLPHGRFISVPGAGHMLHHVAIPDVRAAVQALELSPEMA